MTTDGVRQTRPVDHVRQELAAVSHEIAVRRVEIESAWRKAPVADRVLAVQRMLQEGGLPAAPAAKLEELHERVRAAWVIVRKRGDGVDRHAALRAEMDLQMAEGERDRHVADAHLEMELYRAAESFVMNRPYSPDHPPLKALMLKKHALELELLAGMKALDDDTREDHATQVVRILSAVTWTGEGLPIN